MNDELKNIKINKAFWNGLFISLMVVLVWWGYNFIRGPRIDEGYSFQIKFDDVLNLNSGNDVIYHGLVIGEVKDVGTIGGANSAEIAPIVTLSIKKEYEDKGAKFLNDDKKLIENADIIIQMSLLDEDKTSLLKSNQTFIGVLNPYENKN